MGVFLKKSIALWITLLTIGIVSRLGLGVPNLALIGAVAYLAGQYFKSVKVSASLVVLILLVTDSVLGFYPGMEWVYLGYGFYILGGRWTEHSSFLKQGLVLGAASMAFFILSNLGVWLTTHLYSEDLQGLINCYIMALPFHKVTFVSDVIGFAGLVSCLSFINGIEKRILIYK